MARIRPFIDPEPGSSSGRDYCRANSAAADEFIIDVARVAISGDLALVAVGGYGRGELAPGSDLDLVLLHGPGTDPGPAANAIWYPLWDAGLKLGHAVHTPSDAARLASQELERLTAFSRMRTLSGRMSLTADLSARITSVWKTSDQLNKLARSVDERHRRQGDVAHHLEPDLKQGRGGLRDVHALVWAEAGRPGHFALDLSWLEEAHDQLLDARVALHLHTGRNGDRLLLEDQDAVGALLGTDGFSLMNSIAEAAMSVAWASDDAWGRWHRRTNRPSGGWPTVSHDANIIESEGQIQFSSDADPTDPVTVLRLAVVAATTGLPVARRALEVGSEVRPLSEPWPDDARELLIALLCRGRDAVTVIEALDQYRVVEQLMPEWRGVRHRPQRSALHTFTVDRHLCEASSYAAELTDRVSRPDLLVLGAWLHDIGKGAPGDHTEIGMVLIGTIATRMGFDATDTDTLVRLCQHHLLLSDVAVRRDLDDPGTIAAVAEAVRTPEFLDLLAALTEADSLATGPSVWGTWKAQRLADLVARTHHLLGGGDLTPSESPVSLSTPVLEHLRAGSPLMEGRNDVLSVVTTDDAFVFGRIAGALAVAGLEVVGAVIHTYRQWAGADYVVATESPEGIDWPAVQELVQHSLAGRVALTARLARQAAAEAPFTRPQSAEAPRRSVVIDDELSERATVIDVHAPNRTGLLYDLTRVLAELGLDVRSATAQTVADQAVDSFYVTTANGQKLSAAGLIDEVKLGLDHAIDPDLRG